MNEETLKLAEMTIDLVMESMGFPPGETQTIKSQIIKDTEAIAQEWNLESCPLSDTEED